MKWFTLLVFTYIYEGEKLQARLLFEDEEQCELALRASNTLYKELRRTYRNSMIACDKTDIASGYTVRPKARPQRIEGYDSSF